MVRIYLGYKTKEQIDSISEIIYKLLLGTSVKILSNKNLKGIKEDMLEKKEKIDLIITDTKIGSLNAIELMKTLRKKEYNGEIIYLTESSEGVFETFETSPVEFVLKKDFKRFETVLPKVVQEIESKKLDYIVFGTSSRRYKTYKKDIVYVESIGRKLFVVEADGRSNEYYMTISEMMDLLDSEVFARIHKSFIVNFDHIKEMTKSEVKMKDGSRLSLGRAYVEDIKRLTDLAKENKMMSK